MNVRMTFAMLFLTACGLGIFAGFPCVYFYLGEGLDYLRLGVAVTALFTAGFEFFCLEVDFRNAPCG